MEQNNNSFELINPKGQFPLVLTCEHASYVLPSEYQNLGLSSPEVQRHIGWDLGRVLLSLYSRKLLMLQRFAPVFAAVGRL